MNQCHPQSTAMTGYESINVERWTLSDSTVEADHVAQEQPVALIYNGISYAVMMATPDKLEDFAIGFSLTEGLIKQAREIYSIEIEQDEHGWLIEMTIASQRMQALKARRRNLVGRTGCGLCGAESIKQAIKPATPVVPAPLPKPDKIAFALKGLNLQQPLKTITGATHAAAWCKLSGEIEFIREDVGRHNALDKLIGHLVSSNTKLHLGFALISSRASYEMVQKASLCGISTLVAVSAPTALAVKIANESDMNLIGFARPGRFSVYSRSGKNEQEISHA